MDLARIVLYLFVITLATTLHDPWMIALQAAFGGVALGTIFERMWQHRRPRPGQGSHPQR